MSSVRSRAIISALQSFFSKNKKIVICTAIMFAIGIVVGIVVAVRSVDNDFERIPRADMEFGAAKVFFISSLALVGGYVVLLLSGHSNKTVFLVVIPFVVLGYMCGQYSCILIARYEGTGLLNLLLVYLPFFLFSFVCMMVSAVNIHSSTCTACSGNSTLRPSFVNTLKCIGINLAFNFVVIMLLGSIVGVVIVSLY